MKNEFTLAFNEVLEEKQLPKKVILDALEAAMVSAYRRAVTASIAQHVEAKIDPETGKVAVFVEKEIVDAVQDERTEVSLDDALKVDPNVTLGGMIVVESTPKDFGRVAAQTARQVIQQRIREAERDSQMAHYTKQLGEVVSGVVQAVSPQGITLGLDMKAEGIMPRGQMLPGERFRVHDRVRALLAEVKESPRGPQIILSRAHRDFLRRLLENEVPEIYHGMVEIRSIAREPGQRSKVAVAALQPAVDPVGACVGIRGVRIQAIVRELNEEKIDVIEWSNDPVVYIAKALSPARVTGVYLADQNKGGKTATVVVPEDQLSLAIGRDGQNARLAAKLTAWRIDIKSLPEAAGDALHKLQNEAEYVVLAQHEADIVPQVEGILAKKAEGRPASPEEYQVLTQFVDRIERGIIRQRQGEKRAEVEREETPHAEVSEAAYEIALGDLTISERVYNLLTEAGYHTVGDLIQQIKSEPEAILGLTGIGAKVMREIDEAMTKLPEVKPREKVAAPEVLPVVVEQAAQPVIQAAPEEAAPIAEAQPVAESATVVVVEPAPTAEMASETEPPAQVQAPAVESPPGLAEAVSEEEASALDQLFALQPEGAELPRLTEDEEEDDADKSSKKGKKKKKRFVEIEYDPDQDVTIAKKKRKRGEEWDSGWEI